MGEWAHTIVEAGSVLVGAVGVALTLILYIASNKRQAKDENERRQEELKTQFNDILLGQKYLRPHDHIEIKGPLAAEGIIRKGPDGN